MNIERSDLGFKAFIMLIVSGCIVGLGPVIAKLIAAPAIVIVFYRITLPIPVLYVINKTNGAVKSTAQVRSWHDKVLMVLIGLFFALDLAAFYVSLKYTSVTAATLLSNFSPIFLTSYTLLRKKCFSKEVVCLLISVIGLYFLCGTKSAYTSSEIIGYLTALAAAVFFSFYILLINKVGKKYSSADIMLWSSIGGSLFLLLICLSFHIDIHITTLNSILYILLLSFGVQLIGQTMLTKVISVFPPAFSSLGILIDPVAAAFFSWIILNEPLSLSEMIGAFLILVGIFSSYKFQKSRSSEINNKGVSYA